MASRNCIFCLIVQNLRSPVSSGTQLLLERNLPASERQKLVSARSPRTAAVFLGREAHRPASATGLQGFDLIRDALSTFLWPTTIARNFAEAGLRSVMAWFDQESAAVLMSLVAYCGVAAASITFRPKNPWS